MISVGTNIGAMNAYAAIERAQTVMDRSVERMSTGKRINAARDDAAGISIASRIESATREKITSIRNALDTQSVLEIVDTALDSMADDLLSIREIATKSANDTNSDADRASLNSEVEQKLAQIASISSQSEVSGRELFSGLQLNFFVEGSRSINLPRIDLESLNLSGRIVTEIHQKVVSNTTTTQTVSPVSTPVSVSEEIAVHSSTQFSQKNPKASNLSNGNVITVWQSETGGNGASVIKGQILSADGSQVGIELQLSTPANQKDLNPTLVGLSGGGFAVAWVRSNLDGTNEKTYFQIFENDGSSRTQAVVAGVLGYAEPHIAQISNGNIVIANTGWIDQVVGDTSWGIGVSIYGANGALIKSEFKGHKTINNGQYDPYIIPLSSGGFAITFTSDIPQVACRLT